MWACPILGNCRLLPLRRAEMPTASSAAMERANCKAALHSRQPQRPAEAPCSPRCAACLAAGILVGSPRVAPRHRRTNYG